MPNALRSHRSFRGIDHLLDMLGGKPSDGDVSRKELAGEANISLVEDEGLRPHAILDALQPRGKEIGHRLLATEVNDFYGLAVADERLSQPVAFGCLLEVACFPLAVFLPPH